MKCKKCGEELTEENTIIKGKLYQPQKYQEVVDIEVEHKDCGAIMFAYVVEEDLILAE